MGKHLAPQDRSRSNVGRGVLIVLAVLLAGAVATVVGFGMFRHETPVQVVTQAFVPSPQSVFGKSNLLVLVEGLDYDYNNLDEETSANSRSDVIWAVNLDFDTKQIYQLSVPRDMAVVMPDGHQAKINEAQSDGGVRLAQEVISKFLGVPGFDRYVILRINATRDLINALGGVDVDVQNSDPTDKSVMSYDDTWGHLHIHLKPGFQHLNGDQAVGYMRFRHDFCGDPCRIKRQQQVLKALADKARGDRFNTFIHAGDLLAVVHRDVQTTLTNDELISLAAYFSGTSPSDIHVAQVPYTGDRDLPDGTDALVVDTTGRDQLAQDMLIDPPAPEPSPDATALAAVDAHKLRVDVQNGSGVDGAGKRIADRLHQAGFIIANVGDAPSSDVETTEIHEHTTVTYAGAKVRSALGGTHGTVVVADRAILAPTASPPPSPTSDVTVIVGRDLAATLTAAPSASPHS
ncbi:MAG: LCP family protein [Vulcanimicrobiaceae bacterium]